MTATSLPFSTGALWAGKAWALWRRKKLFFSAAALLILALRWTLDLSPSAGGSALLILASYLTDALVVAALWLALNQDGGGSLWGGWRHLAGRRWRVAAAGLWGLPSAGIGFVLLSLPVTLMQPVGMALGARAAGWATLAWVFLSGAFCCLLLFAALLAVIAAAEGEDHLWKAGMKGLRAALLGWRPLLALWTAFVCGAALFATVTAAILGHLSLEVLDGPARDGLERWINWPALFIAVSVLLALLGPAARQLFAASRGENEAPHLLASFGESLAHHAARLLYALAALLGLASLFALNLPLQAGLVGAAGLATTGWALSRCAPAWGDADARRWARWNWLLSAGLWALVFAVMRLG